MKTLAIVGRPNVGKSSFFNRIIKQRDAITSEQAGTTRDVKKRVIDILDKEVMLYDTGGLDDGNELFDKIREMSLKAAHSADIIIYMVDGKSIPEEEDKKFFYELEALGKDIALVVNKVDNDKMLEKVWDYYEFGTEHVFGISVSHNRHINALFEWIADLLPEKEIVETPTLEAIIKEADIEVEEDENVFVGEYIEDNDDSFFEDYEEDEEDEEDDGYFYPAKAEEDYIDKTVYGENDKVKPFDENILNTFRVAIIGRVNVGKSSLLNALLKEERSVVSATAGTTIDPIDEEVEYENHKITFIDTAGIRKRGKILGIEKFALMRTEEMLDDANIALIVLDASNPFLDLDEKIAGLIDSNRLACLIVLNKWDLVDGADYAKIVQSVRDRFRFLHYAPIISISANTAQRVHKIYEMLIKINANYSQRITTSKLNEALIKAQRRHPLPSMRGAYIRIYYATQYEIRPPRIALVMNKPKGLHFTYRRYLTNKLRQEFDFEGIPVLFKARKRGEH